jgi:PhnB protein
MMNLNPRIGLSFNGNCEAAFRLYERWMKGQVEFMLRWGESPMGNDAPPEWKDKILHARLVVGDTELLGADALPGTYKAPAGFSILLSLYDSVEMEHLYKSLAENGTVTMPLQETFWAKRFASVVDQFGIPWTLNYEKSE